MKILLLGKNGQVGWELQRALAPLGEIVALGREGDPAAGLCGDLAATDRLAETVERVAPDVIVNAAAYTAVDKAEADEVAAQRINAEAVAVLAQAAARRRAWLVHYSTDYVFDGSGEQPWREDDPVGPINAYGRSKLAGEAAILAADCRHLILRTSWVYASRGSNFARTILRLAGEREQLSVIDDQVGAPTGADLIADVTAHALRTALGAGGHGLSGLYHLAAAGQVSWHGYAELVLAAARARGATLRVQSVRPVSSAEYPVAARRPLNSRLDSAKLRAAFGITLPGWRFGVDRLVTELTEK